MLLVVFSDSAGWLFVKSTISSQRGRGIFLSVMSLKLTALLHRGEFPHSLLVPSLSWPFSAVCPARLVRSKVFANDGAVYIYARVEFPLVFIEFELTYLAFSGAFNRISSEK